MCLLPDFDHEQWYEDEEVYFQKGHVTFDSGTYQHVPVKNNSKRVLR